MEFKLILKKLNNTLTQEEAIIFNAWYKESPEHRAYFKRVQQGHVKGAKPADLKKGWQRVSASIGDERRSRQKVYLQYAAVLALVLGGAFLWHQKSQENEPNKEEQVVTTVSNDIEIGTDKARLTLANGKQVTLEKGKPYQNSSMASNGSKLVYKKGNPPASENIAQNSLTIPRGGQFFVALSDGTKVWLNSETQLKYPETFIPGDVREVTLVYGEAYFEVSPSSEHKGSPFIVNSESQSVEVLGTQFNVKAYEGALETATTLVEGKVKVRNTSFSVDLVPGEQSRIEEHSDNIAVAKVNVYDQISWKDGLFSFTDKNLEEILEVLSRWYNVEIVYRNEALKSLKFNGVFRKSLRLEDILDILKNTNEINYETNNKTIIMM